MTRDEFEKILSELEMLVRQKLPAMINVILLNKGNQDQERAFQQFIEKLQRYRKILLKDLEKVARPNQKVRYFNVTYNIDSQLRSMSKREEIQRLARLKYHRTEIPVVYDIGKGPEEGRILNIINNEVLLSTEEVVPVNQEVEISVKNKTAKGKTTWSLSTTDDHIETGIRLENGSLDIARELETLLKALEKESKEPV